MRPERIIELTTRASVESLDGDRSRREALLWSFTVLGEASSQLDDELKVAHPEVSVQDVQRSLDKDR